MKLLRIAPMGIVTAAFGAPLPVAPNLRVEMIIQEQAVAEYHFPYVAIWIERPDETPVATFTVWYDTRNPGGIKYLEDLRVWWRTLGQQMTWQADGLSSVTRAPGLNGYAMLGSSPMLSALPRGDYNIVIEAAREGGAHEIVRVPLLWDGKPRVMHASGTADIGQIRVEIYP